MAITRIKSNQVTDQTLIGNDLAPSLTYNSSLTITGTLTANAINAPVTGNLTGAASANVLKAGDTMTGFLTLNADPVDPLHAAPKQYVDAVAQGLHVKEGVDSATTDTLAVLSGGSVTYDNGVSGAGATLTLGSPLSTMDGHTLIDGDRVLIKNEVNQAHNGIYVRTSSTVFTRDPLFDSDEEIEGGDFVFVVEGTVYASTGWVQVNTVNIVGTDDIVWVQFAGAGTYDAGTGLTLTGTTFSITPVGTPGTYTKVTTNASGQVTTGTTLSASDIPVLDASKITTGILDNARTTATNLNQASAIVARDSSGNFTASTISATLSGNASTATALQTARTIAVSGDVAGSALFDGTGNISIVTTIQPNAVVLGTDTAGTYISAVATSGVGLSASGGGAEDSTATITSNATALNTPSTIVARDINGDFTANTITAALTGNASTATSLQVSRSIAVGGDLSGSASFNGTSDITITATIQPDSVALGTDTTGDYVATVGTSGVGISASGTGESAAVTITSNATALNTPSTIVSRDVSGNFAAGTITAALTGNASTATALQTSRNIALGGDLSGSAAFNGTSDITITATITGSIGSADVLSTARSIALGGELSGSALFDGSQDITITATITGSAPTADALTTSRNIALGGDLSGSAAFNGTSDITITAAVADNSHDHTIANVTGLQTALDGKLSLTGGTMSGTITGTTDNRAVFAGTGSIYTDAGVEVREVNRVAGAQNTYPYAPAISFHWNTLNAGTLAMHADGHFYLRAQTYTGTEYRNLTVATLNGTSTAAKYADLAENYVADAPYPPGTVLEFGGDYEVTLSMNPVSFRVAGVVSTNPAHLMNADCQGEHIVAVALRGRVPCRVRGRIDKGDLVVSAGNGIARAWDFGREGRPHCGAVFGKALESYRGLTDGTIEIVVG